MLLMIQVFFKVLSFILKDGDERKFNHHQTQLWIRNENTAGKDYFLKIRAYNKMALYANKDKKCSLEVYIHCPIHSLLNLMKMMRPDMSNIIQILMLTTNLTKYQTKF